MAKRSRRICITADLKQGAKELMAVRNVLFPEMSARGFDSLLLEFNSTREAEKFVLTCEQASLLSGGDPFLYKRFRERRNWLRDYHRRVAVVSRYADEIRAEGQTDQNLATLSDLGRWISRTSAILASLTDLNDRIHEQTLASGEYRLLWTLERKVRSKEAELSELTRYFWNTVKTLRRDISQIRYLGSFTFSARDLRNPESFARKLKDFADPVSCFVRDRLPDATRQKLDACLDGGTVTAELQAALAAGLNALIRQTSIWDKERFKNVKIRAETRKLLRSNPTGRQIIPLNRLLLEDTYPESLRTPNLWPPRSTVSPILAGCSSEWDQVLFPLQQFLGEPDVLALASKTARINTGVTELQLSAKELSSLELYDQAFQENGLLAYHIQISRKHSDPGHPPDLTADQKRLESTFEKMVKWVRSALEATKHSQTAPGIPPQSAPTENVPERGKTQEIQINGTKQSIPALLIDDSKATLIVPGRQPTVFFVGTNHYRLFKYIASKFDPKIEFVQLELEEFRKHFDKASENAWDNWFRDLKNLGLVETDKGIKRVFLTVTRGP